MSSLDLLALKQPILHEPPHEHHGSRSFYSHDTGHLSIGFSLPRILHLLDSDVLATIQLFQNTLSLIKKHSLPDALLWLLSFPHSWSCVVAALFNEPFVVRELHPIINIIIWIEPAFLSDWLSGEVLIQLHLLEGALLGCVTVLHRVSL